MIKANYITVDEFKEYAPEVDTSQFTDATISGIIAQSSDWVDTFLDYSLSVEEIEDEKVQGYQDADYNLILFPRKVPILSITSLKIVRGQYEAAITLESNGKQNYDIPSKGDRIEFPTYQLGVTSNSIFLKDIGRRFFTLVDYSAGYQTIPDVIKRAVVLVTKDNFSGQQNVSGANRVRQGGIEIEYGERNLSDSGDSDMIMDAKKILTAFKRPTLW